MEASAAHGGCARRGGPEEDFWMRESSALCSCWAHGLRERERLAADAAEVAAEALDGLLAEPTYRNAGILLDGLARAGVRTSAPASVRAAALLHRELAKGPRQHGACAEVWVDLARQFEIPRVSREAWLQCRDQLLQERRWSQAARLCSAAAELGSECVLDRALEHGTRYHEDLVSFSPRLSPRTQQTAMRRLADSGYPQVADRIRRACAIGTAGDRGRCPEGLQRQLQRDLLRHLVELGLRSRAAELAARADILDEVHDLLGPGVHEDSPSLEPGQCRDTGGGQEGAQAFTVETGAISLVDSPDAAAAFAAAAAGAEGPVGLDCEWPPAERGVSICQVSLSERIWVLDLRWAWSAGDRQVQTALRQLFADPAVLKLGFGFQEDLDRLHVTLSEDGGMREGVRNFVDLQVDGRGLASLFRAATGSTLDKSLQCSAWGARPLGQAQLQYAAADARCLLRLYEALKADDRQSLKACHLIPQESQSSTQDDSEHLTVEHVRAAVSAGGLDGTFVGLDDEQPSINGSQAANGNVLCFVVKPDRRPVAVAAREGAKVDLAALARVLKVGKGKIAMASPAECVRLFGFAPGAVPPVGLRPEVGVWLSSSLRIEGAPVLCFSGGGPRARVLLDAAALAAHYGEDRWLADGERPLVPLALAVRRVVRGEAPPKFACDSMLCRLAHKLRSIDLDVAVVGDLRSHAPDDAEPRPLPRADRPLRPTAPCRRREEERLLELAEGGRIALTSSTSTQAAMHGIVYLLRGMSADDQLREVCIVFGINGRERAENAMDRRCCVCNWPITTISKEAVVGKVPKRAIENYNVFFTCARDPCKTIFWRGSSYLEGQSEIQHALEDLCF
mmetsp:Transcript_10706/g.33948  ORF Transcript_10706/g.33948 Transcript_10706/m.33948 type:complete len:850 (+) Transcript_10706:2-2551(+)